MKDDFKLDPNIYLPLHEVVFNTLRRAILTGELDPGERLMEIHLASRFGVSRTPVREAIRSGCPGSQTRHGCAVRIPSLQKDNRNTA